MASEIRGVECVGGEAGRPFGPHAKHGDPKIGIAAEDTHHLRTRRMHFVVADAEPFDHAVPPAENGATFEHQVPSERARRIRQHLADVGPTPEPVLRVIAVVFDPTKRSHVRLPVH